MPRYRILIFVFCLFLVFVPARAQASAVDSSGTAMVSEYVKAFNAPEESQMIAFFMNHIQPGELKRVPMELRLDRYRQLKQDLTSVTLEKILDVSRDRVKAVLQDARGKSLVFTFNVANDPAHGLVSIGVMMADELDHVDSEASPARTDDELVSLAKGIVDSLSSADAFSGVVLIAKGRTPIFRVAHGLADKERKIFNTVDTKFNIGSINKAFTSIVIHQLVKEGKLSLDDTIEKFLPSYPNVEAREKVTVRHLLSMSSGIGDIFGERYQSTPKEKLRTIDDFIPLFADKPLEFAPGTRRQYSNGGFVVLGAIIEKVSGQDYYSYVRDHVFVPAGMLETDSYSKDAAVARRALGYTSRGENEVKDVQVRTNNYPTLPGRGSSAGGGYSTAEDLLRFVSAIKDGKLWSPELSAPDGFGIAGGAPGLNAEIEWVPERGYTIIVLSNYDPPSARRVAAHIKARLPR